MKLFSILPLTTTLYIPESLSLLKCIHFGISLYLFFVLLHSDLPTTGEIGSRASCLTFRGLPMPENADATSKCKTAWLACRNLIYVLKVQSQTFLCLIFSQDVHIVFIKTLLRKKLLQKRSTLGFVMKK